MFLASRKRRKLSQDMIHSRMKASLAGMQIKAHPKVTCDEAQLIKPERLRSHSIVRQSFYSIQVRLRRKKPRNLA